MMYLPVVHFEPVHHALDFPDGFIPDKVPCFALNNFVDVYVSRIIQATLKLEYEVYSDLIMKHALEIEPFIKEYLVLSAKGYGSEKYKDLMAGTKRRIIDSNGTDPYVSFQLKLRPMDLIVLVKFQTVLNIYDPLATFFISLLEYNSHYFNELIQKLTPQIENRIRVHLKYMENTCEH